MHFETYDPVTGDLIGQISILDFGDLIQGQHCSKPIVARAIANNETITNFKMFLQNIGLAGSSFGYYKNASFIRIEAGDSRFTLLTLVPNPIHTSPGSISLTFTAGKSEYLWLDVQVTQVGNTDANFRIFFDHT